ncbi:uracil-xanthine permease family protein [Sphingomonas crusticola]|uniref:uracil-xanthine permease family protein n=1 Tax=Sphingomonas crusticola TaxID=1697973 RepID=UPI000E271DD1|nr:solute carrier family 23 protein [Sphingomonas crusticola]
MRQLAWLLPPVAPSRRTKPEEIVYGFDERPPTFTLVSVGVQHAVLALMLGIYTVIAGRGIGLTGPALVHYTGSCFFVLGIGTMLQAWRSRLTPGVPLVSVPNIITLGAYTSVVVHYGLGAAMGAIMIANLVVIALARRLPRMRAIFPPEVIGVVVLMLGLSMVTGGVRRSVAVSTNMHSSGWAVLAAVTTIACIIGLSVWGTRQLRTMAVLIGMVAGVVVAVLTGVAHPAALRGIADLPAMTLPIISSSLPLPSFVPTAVAAILLTELLSAMDQFAGVLTLDKLNDAHWRRADMPMVARSVVTMGIENFLHGLTGTLTGGSSAANIGLANSTGIMSRHVGFVAGATICLVAFVPVIPALLVMTPEPVIGGILIYTAAFMIVAGMDLVLSRLLNPQRTYTVGLSVVLGTAIMLSPDLVQGAPLWSQAIVGSGLTIGSIAAIALNALFRIGVKRSAETALAETHPTAEAASFIEHNGKVWGARREVVMRAAMAVGEALEAIDAEALRRGPVRLVVTFDEFNLACRLCYPGVAPIFTDRPVDAVALLDEDDSDALIAAGARLSALLIVRLADRVHASTRNGAAELVLNFDH